MNIYKLRALRFWVASLLFLLVAWSVAPVARAGEWEVQGLSPTGNTHSEYFSWGRQQSSGGDSYDYTDVSKTDLNEGNLYALTFGYGHLNVTHLGTSAGSSGRNTVRQMGIASGYGSVDYHPQMRLIWHRRSEADLWGPGGSASPDPNDNPPSYVYVRENASLSGGATSSDYYKFQLTGEDMGLSLRLVTSTSNPRALDYEDSTSKITKFKAEGDTVLLPARSFGGRVDVSPGYEKESSSTYGVLLFNYSAEVLQVSISGSPYRGAATKYQPDSQEYNAYAKQNYTRNGDDQATTGAAFWDGSGSYSVSGTPKDSYSPIFNPQLYKWEITGDGTPFIPEPEDQSSAYRYLPDADAGMWASKEFHLNLGTGNDSFPKTSVIKGTITNEDGSQQIPTQITVHWHQPRWFVTKVGPVTTVAGNQDPDKASGPIDPSSVSPDDPDFQEMQTITAYIAEREAFIKTGAELVKAGLEVYVEVAKLPFYELGGELGGEGLIEAISKVQEFAKTTAKIRESATGASEIALEARRLAQQGSGKSAEEVANLEALATKAEQQAKEADTLATEAEQFAVRAQEKIRRAQDIQGWREHTTPDDLTAAADALNGTHLYKPGGDIFQHLKEVKEAQGGIFDRVKAIKNGLSNPNLSPENFQDLTEELGVVSKMLDETEQYVPRG